MVEVEGIEWGMLYCPVHEYEFSAALSCMR